MPANVTLKPREFVMALSSTAAGGFVGTLLRDLLTGAEHLPSTSLNSVTWPQEIPWALLAINFVGVLFVTRLLRGPLRHHDPNNLTRLLIVTGFFGGLTSYSGLFIDLAAIWHVSIGGCLLVTVGAILSGVFAGWLGLMRHRR
jgi:fluoride ion exporter CrcB/FEX